MSYGDSQCELSISEDILSMSRFRQDLRLYPPREDTGDMRYTVYDPKTDLSYFFGAVELKVAQLFNGRRTLEEIVEHIKNEHGKTFALSKMQAYEHKLKQMGLITSSIQQHAKKLKDPAIGISYGPLKSMLMLTVLRIDPANLIDWLYRHFRWLCTPVFSAFGVITIGLAMVLIVNNSALFWKDVKVIYGGHPSWLLWHYPVVVVSIFVHEVGHALSCRHYKVRITDFGIAIYLLLATGWARPLQGDWSELRKRQRLISIGMGPYASLLFVAAGVFLWLLTGQMLEGSTVPVPAIAFFHVLSVVMTVSATLALIPTLLPMFNGDTYLAITELISVPRLRQRAFRYLKNLWSRHPQEEHLSSRRKALYWLTIGGTVLGWVAIWILVVQLIVSIYRWMVVLV
jgi:putative peptide zinc metalloprotease protein